MTILTWSRKLIPARRKEFTYLARGLDAEMLITDFTDNTNGTDKTEWLDLSSFIRDIGAISGIRDGLHRGHRLGGPVIEE